MRLTTLEIKGFKSFADKTVVRFDRNITGVVGPNGCGKSNIVDAIRWVLGEQKTSMLRLEKMDNLIFNGTKKRRASGLAEVSLTFENTRNILPTEFQTVTITRRLFRSGDSEYRLNDVPCRLKDITNLFLDTGISSDSYAIIELGMVDEILNDRDHSRRRLFEQASGISKYKTRKKETIRKLKGTEDDLARVEDLLFEIEKNMKTLERQAKRARRYNALREEYRTLSLEWARAVLDQHRADYKALEKQEADQQDRLVELDKEVMQVESAIEKEKLGVVEKEKALANLQKELNELLGGVNSRENERNVLRERIRFNISRQDELNASLRDLEPRTEELAQRIAGLEAEIESVRRDVEASAEALETLATDRDAARARHDELKETVDGRKAAYDALNERLNTVERRIAVNESRTTSYRTDLFTFREEAETLDERSATITTSLAEAEEAHAQTARVLAEAEEAETARRTTEEETRAAFEDVRERATALRRRLDAQRNEYDLTKSLVDNLEGFPESIKFLKRSDAWSVDAPLLSDLIYCPEDYRVAIEVFLEPVLNHYVVATTADALSGIRALRDADKGRAHFFVLDRLGTARVPENDPAGLTPALSVIEVGEAHRPLFEHLLGGVYFADEEAVTEAFDAPGVRAVLTTGGGLIAREDRISGGTVGLFEGKRIGRAKNLEKLERSIEAATAEEADLTAEEDRLRSALETIRAERDEEGLDTARTAAAETEKRRTALASEKQAVENEIERSKTRSADLEQALEDLATERTALDAERTELDGERTTLRADLEAHDERFTASTEALEAASSAYNEHRVEHLQRTNRQQQLERELDYARTELDGVRTRIEEQRTGLRDAVQAVETDTEALQEIESALLTGYENKDAFEERVRAAEETFYAARGRVNELEEDYRAKQRAKHQADGLMTTIKDRFNELKLQLSSLRERLRIEFDADINDLLNEERTTEQTREELEDGVEVLRGKIERFGEVNPMAVEAFDEMKERFDFISAQRNDLIEARDSLLDTIQEIEETARSQFLEAFHQVRENFQTVFRTLFTQEDECDLKLLDPDDPLESKIEIMAKPKGKRPQIIDQLSGGEKTLTATALLFSLYLLKPAPFCVFDEVDAPLDDNNIDKFNRIIREFSASSQFIIVTHNKQTMSHVDVIYGVTMAEPGVSRVLAVDLSELTDEMIEA